MGSRVTVGALIFNVLETRWVRELGQLSDLRRPKHQFLLVRLSVTNAGGAAAGFPMLSLLNDQGEAIPESEDGSSVPEWAGLIRNIDPTDSIIGWILFDAPLQAYNLQLTDGKLENEATAIVELPFRLN